MLLIGGNKATSQAAFAASIVATDYNITKGSLWVAPKFRSSIMSRSRGTKGDMNRKFAHVEKDDPGLQPPSDEDKKTSIPTKTSLILKFYTMAVII